MSDINKPVETSSAEEIAKEVGSGNQKPTPTPKTPPVKPIVGSTSGTIGDSKAVPQPVVPMKESNDSTEAIANLSKQSPIELVHNLPSFGGILDKSGNKEWSAAEKNLPTLDASLEGEEKSPVLDDVPTISEIKLPKGEASKPQETKAPQWC